MQVWIRIKLWVILCSRDVEFNYPDATVPTIKNLNLEIRAGTKVAIVGRTGSGKEYFSTVIT